LERMSHEKRLEIITAAMKLFAEKGFERSTVEKIAARANVGKGTVYLYFKNKERIFWAILEQGLIDMEKLITNIPPDRDFCQQFRDTICNNLAYIETHRDFYRLFIKERLTVKFLSEASVDQLLLKKHHTIFRSLANLMQRGIDQSVLLPGDPYDYGTAVAGILNHFAAYWLMRDSGEPLTAKTEVIYSLIMNGIKNCT
jgi:TetR/AcrR family transcriptional regulator